MIGWTYFFCWTLSFYPQIILNHVRKNTIGMKSDKLVFDLIGFSCLSIYFVSFHFDTHIRKEYETMYGTTPLVQINDVCFAVHAVFCTLIQIIQISQYNGMDQRPSLTSLFAGFITLLGIIIYYIMSVRIHYGALTIMNWLYFISYVKIGITLIKYLPQVLLNIERKSTVGWSITAVNMDISGSLLSMMQLVLDCYDVNDWSALTGNIVKLALGSVSLVFDITFCIQHYWLFPSGEPLQQNASSSSWLLSPGLGYFPTSMCAPAKPSPTKKNYLQAINEKWMVDNELTSLRPMCSSNSNSSFKDISDSSYSSIGNKNEKK